MPSTASALSVMTQSTESLRASWERTWSPKLTLSFPTSVVWPLSLLATAMRRLLVLPKGSHEASTLNVVKMSGMMSTPKTMSAVMVFVRMARRSSRRMVNALCMGIALRQGFGAQMAAQFVLWQAREVFGAG